MWRYALDERLSVSNILFPEESSLRASEPVSDSHQPLAIQVAEFEAQVIRRTLAAQEGRIKEVMEILDLPRRTLNQKMAKYGISRTEFKE